MSSKFFGNSKQSNNKKDKLKAVNAKMNNKKSNTNIKKSGRGR